jgi:hypothetical protein
MFMHMARPRRSMWAIHLISLCAVMVAGWECLTLWTVEVRHIGVVSFVRECRLGFRLVMVEGIIGRCKWE